MLLWEKDTPQSPLLFRTTLYQRTSPSGQRMRCQKYESMNKVRLRQTNPNGTAKITVLIEKE